MQCQKIIELLEQHSPSRCAMEWDNVGLLSGRREKEVQVILIALDATDSVIQQAIARKADLLLTHHPLLFTAQKSITTDDIIGRRLIQLIQHDISYYAMHTNFDVRGMAELSEQKLGLTKTQVLEVTATHADGTEEGIGRVGTLAQPMSLKNLSEYVKQQFQLESVRICGNQDAVMERVAVSGGSGKSMVHPALKAGADVLISGDLDHHTVLDALAEGLCIIDAGHYGTEKMFVPYIRQYLLKKCTELDERNLVMAAEQDPFFII